MKIKDMAEEIKKQMPKDLNELEMLRYIYIYIGKRKSFDPRYYFGNSETRNKIYRLASQKIRDENFLVENKELICTSISNTLRLVAKEFGIELALQKDEKGVGAHMYNLAKLKDGRVIKLDLQRDLGDIHIGHITRNFGDLEVFCNCISDEELEKIDEKIGYKKENYKGNNIAILRKQTQNMKVLDAIRFVLNSDKFNTVLKEAEGYIELLDYVKTALQYCTGEINPPVINCYRDENINKQALDKRQYSMCIYAEKGNDFNIYLFKKKERRFVEVTPERMIRLVNEGLKIENKSHNSKKLIKRINHTSLER